MNRRILLLFAHPTLERSRVHRRLLGAVAELDGVTVHDLYQRYPDFDVDVHSEQELLLAHDLIVLQHPLYWYSTPPLVKQWLDLVLEHGWAYGSGGTALRGKSLLSVVSAGARASSYGPDGLHRFTVRQFLAPLEQTAELCGVRYLPPFLVFATHALSTTTIDRYARSYRRTLSELRDGSFDLEEASQRSWIDAAEISAASGD